MIRKHWAQVQRDQARCSKHTSEEVAETLLQGFGKSLVKEQSSPHSWAEPTVAHLTSAVRRSSGSAGPDSWTGDELSNAPDACICLFHRLSQRWGVAAQVPTQLEEGRQVNLPKPHKVYDAAYIKAADTRPITVLSVWWRAYATAWATSPSLKQWLAKQVAPEVCGLADRAGCEESGAMLQDHLVKVKGVLVSLDYSQCFDRLDPAATALLLQELHWPSSLVNAMLAVWGKGHRWIQWGGHTHPVPLKCQAAPQGCPLAPAILSIWLSSGVANVYQRLRDQGYAERHLDKSLTRTYMDDRTFVCPTWPDARDRANAWFSFSSQVNLRENEDKAQACGKTRHNQLLVQKHRPEWTKQMPKVLGITSVTRPRKEAESESQRLNKGHRRLHLLSCLKLPFEQFLPCYRALVLPVVTYGWIGKLPGRTRSNAIFTDLSTAMGTLRLANGRLREVVYGANTHLDAVLGQRLFARVSKLKAKIALTWTNDAYTSIGQPRRWLAKCGWVPDGPWKWKAGAEKLQVVQDGNPVGVEKQKHNIRHRWRHENLFRWAAGRRHEAAALRGTLPAEQIVQELRSTNLEWIRKQTSANAESRSVLLGTVASFAWLAKAKGQSDRESHAHACAWCNRSLGDWLHLAWECPEAPSRATRPAKPRRWLQARFGWPALRQNSQDAWRILQHLASTVTELWRFRHGRN